MRSCIEDVMHKSDRVTGLTISGINNTKLAHAKPSPVHIVIKFSVIVVFC